MRFGLARVRVHGFRSIREATLWPGPLCALVGEANAGKSNLLAAVRAVLDHSTPPFARSDVAAGDGAIGIEAELARGRRVALEAAPPGQALRSGGSPPPALFLPAELRAGSVAAPNDDPRVERAAAFLRGIVAEQVAPQDRASVTAPALSFVAGLESCCAFGVRGVVLLIEEPELYLRPQAQRYLYRLLRTFARGGNQVVYSTHSPAFLNVARLDELALVTRDPRTGTEVFQPEPLPATKDFRALSEFDAERSELFLARAALLVEGRSEKLVFPFVFEALGHDPDREGISIVECGGKGNVPLFARICRSTHIPFVVVHDRDSGAPADQVLNAEIAEIVGAERTIVLDPDLEGVAELRGHRHKPERARERFAAVDARVPAPLTRAVELVLALARD